MSDITGFAVVILIGIVFIFYFDKKKKSVKKMKDELTESELEGTTILEDFKKEISNVDITEFKKEILCKLDKEKIRQYNEEYKMTREQAFYINGLEYAIKIINEYDNKPKQYFTIE